MTWPLFILAPPRSFTSVTCGMLGQHPEMFGLPETNLFARETYRDLKSLYRARERFRHGYARSVAQLAFAEQSESNIDVISAWLEQSPDVSTGDLFRDLVIWASPKHLVDKSPIYVYDIASLERIGESFPEARYLHLTRHPRGTCESIFALRKSTSERGERFRQMMAEQGRPQPSPRSPSAELTPETMWLDPHLRILRFLENVPAEQHMRLRGEELLADPDHWLAEIARWLGISDEAHALDAMKHPERSPFASFGPNNARFGNDPSFLENPILRGYKKKKDDLDRPLSWDEKLHFGSEVRELAGLFEY